jgi:voltage-gated potassium channel
MEQLHIQRNKLLISLTKLLEGPMVFLGFVWLTLLVIELIWGLSPVLESISLTIWALFILDFILKLWIAPRKLAYIKKNWLTALALLLPAFRVLRVFRFMKVFGRLRGLRLVKIVSSVNRSMRGLAVTMSRRGFGYVVVLSTLVTLLGAAGMYGFEKTTQASAHMACLYGGLQCGLLRPEAIIGQ